MTATNTDSLILGNKCAGCGTERKTKNLRYDPATFLAYCENPWVCNEKHPNSPANLIKNQKETLLISFAEANEAYKKELIANLDADMMQMVYKIMQKPTTVRIQDPEMAQFLVQFQKETGSDNLSETIRQCVQLVKENRGAFYQDHKQAAETVKKEVTKQETVKAIEENKPEPVKDDMTF